jgi:hypothetical protein
MENLITEDRLVLAPEIHGSVELFSGEDAHPEIAEPLLMPRDERFAKLVENNELDVIVRVVAGLETKDEDPAWLIGYHSSDTADTSPHSYHELARAFICSQKEDPNGFYARDLFELLLNEAEQGNVASEVVDFLNEKIAEVHENLKASKFESIK